VAREPHAALGAPPREILAAGLAVQPVTALEIAALRYFDAREAVPAGVIAALGGALPNALEAVRRAGAQGDLVLGWRTPTETLVLAVNPTALEPLAHAVAGAPGWGCIVSQTGGLHAWRVSGERTRDLLVRVGSLASVPAWGEARTSRMAELPVVSLCVSEAEVILVVERVYEEHLLGWIAETAADL
jgi:sarcosine oxidase gamma subunit